MKSLFILSLTLLTLSASSVNAFEALVSKPTLIKFCSDGCTMAPSGIIHRDQWESCCFNHDYAYWKGGSRENKDEADMNFYSCLESRTSKTIAIIYYKAVSKLGDKRWGSGWSDREKFLELDNAELAIVLEMTPKDEESIMCKFVW